MSTEQRLPSGTIDAHVHVFTPDTHPYTSGRSYTPGRASVADLLAGDDALGVRREIVVQPSPYGLDNTATLAAVDALGPDRARAVVVVDPTDSDTDTLLADPRVVGVRLNHRSDPRSGGEDLQEPLTALIGAAARAGVFVQLFVSPASLVGVRKQVETAPVPVVLDHFGGLRLREDDDPLAFEDGADLIADLLSTAPVWVKLSAPCRVFDAADDRFGDGRARLDEVVTRFASIAPDRLVWGSDRPHTGGDADRIGRPAHHLEPFRRVDDIADATALVSVLKPLAPAVFVENTARLAGF